MALYGSGDRLIGYLILSSLGSSAGLAHHLMKQRINLTSHSAEEGRFARAELRVHALAKRQARKQLLRIPWRRFNAAYEEYPRWQGLALWSRSILAGESPAPSLLVKTLREQCPGLMEAEASSREPRLLGFRLLEWIHQRVFGYAQRQGWLEALTFYGVRHPSSRAAWAFWEKCENEGSGMQPSAVLSFDEWWQAVQQSKFCNETTYLDVEKTVERYLNWEGLLLWISPLLNANLTLPPYALSEMERRCPDLFNARGAGAAMNVREGSNGRRLFMKWRREHCLRQAQEEGWVDSLVAQIRIHPWHVRMRAYASHESQQLSGNRAHLRPSFLHWQQKAESYVETGSQTAATH